MVIRTHTVRNGDSRAVTFARCRRRVGSHCVAAPPGGCAGAKCGLSQGARSRTWRARRVRFPPCAMQAAAAAAPAGPAHSSATRCSRDVLAARAWQMLARPAEPMRARVRSRAARERLVARAPARRSAPASPSGLSERSRRASTLERARPSASAAQPAVPIPLRRRLSSVRAPLSAMAAARELRADKAWDKAAGASVTSGLVSPALLSSKCRTRSWPWHRRLLAMVAIPCQPRRFRTRTRVVRQRPARTSPGMSLFERDGFWIRVILPATAMMSTAQSTAMSELAPWSTRSSNKPKFLTLRDLRNELISSAVLQGTIALLKSLITALMSLSKFDQSSLERLLQCKPLLSNCAFSTLMSLTTFSSPILHAFKTKLI